jgi:integrase
LTREEVRQILTFASPRDRVIWLIMAESGMRAETAINLRYWQIKEDFEAKKIPMRILLPSATLKDHVGPDRFTFIGEDGFRELSEYLKRRLPLKDQDFVFASEKAAKVVGEQFSVASLSVKFNRLIQKLKMDSPREHKPKSVRMHNLRRYFRNNMRVDSAFVNFWMGHSLGVDAHYITRDVERHREEYKKGYEYLRVFEPSAISVIEILEQLRRKDLETKALKEEIAELRQKLDALTPEYRIKEEIIKVLREMGLTAKQ